MSHVLSVYMRLLKHHPWKVNSLQTGTLMAAGDIVSQSLVEKKKLQEMDPLRIARFGCLGAIFAGPFVMTWYQVLNYIVKPSRKGNKERILIVAKKAFLDQVVLSPPYFAAFLIVNGAIQQKSWASIQQSINDDFKDILFNNWKFWTPVQLVNFGFVPLKFQVLFEQLFSFVWNIYMAWKINRPKDSEEQNTSTRQIGKNEE